MPGSTPATSQLDWLSSTMAMIVLSWSKAARDLLKSFSWGIRALRQLFASDDGAISSPPAPYHLSAGGSRIRTLGPAEDLQRPWPASVPVRGRLFLVTGKSARGDFEGLEDLGRVTRDREFEAGFSVLRLCWRRSSHSSRSI